MRQHRRRGVARELMARSMARKGRPIDSVSARNGGTTQSMRIHHWRVGKNQPPTSGPTMVFTISE